MFQDIKIQHFFLWTTLLVIQGVQNTLAAGGLGAVGGVAATQVQFRGFLNFEFGGLLIEGVSSFWEVYFRLHNA